jgi:hypothetical protein
MDTSLPAALTPRQRFWLAHLEACREQGSSLKAYALAHDLSPGALYAAKSDLKHRGVLPASVLPVPAPKLLPVHIARAIPMFRVLLPNGVVVEVAEHADGSCCRELLACVSALA